jgi:hypothetical protein
MTEKQNLVEEAIIQLKNLENLVAENAKGILSSTMGKEINELVKESLKTEEESEEDEMEFEFTEQEDEDVQDVQIDAVEPADDEMDFDDMGDDESMDMEDDTEMDSDVEDMEIDMDDEPIDLTSATDEEILKVFKAMGDEDGIIITKDGSEIHLQDDTDDVEYKISLGESDEDMMEEFGEFEFDMEDDDMEDMESEEDDEEIMYEITMDDDDEMEESMHEMDEEMDFEEEDEDEIMYEITMDGDDEDEFEESMDEMYEEEMEAEEEMTSEAFKPKGVGMGKPKFSYKNTKGGFNEKKKHANPKMGTGKAKFEFKEGDTKTAPVKPKTKPSTKPTPKHPLKPKPGTEGAPKATKEETKEASRTLKSGKYWGREGLPKPRTAPRHLRVEAYEEQLETLRSKNEEYRKALNVFRDKLTEVAVFNSNLAYATRLFTEHSTTKQEKINILRRFDSVESIKESKSLYKTIKDELSNESKSVVKESIENKLDKTPVSGSATTLIENKVHENTQFTRIKDLMSKINNK